MSQRGSRTAIVIVGIGVAGLTSPAVVCGQVAPTDVAGCYDVHMTVQSDGTSPRDIELLTRWPDRFRLLADTVGVPGIPVSFRAESLDGRPDHLALVAWWTAVGDGRP